MRIGEAPCKDCGDRQLGCHSICQKYKDWKVNQKRMKRADETQRFNDIYFTHHYQQLNKACKKRNISFRNNAT